jgi:two-component sensor histidine kinase
MQALIDYASYMPHGYCLFWQPWLVALYAGSDLLIFLSYSLIPGALIVFLRRRPDVRFRGLVALFAAFILLCGLTHLISIVTLWIPVYPLHGAAKLVTGVVSATTAVVLFRLVPRLVEIPSPAQLEQANEGLRSEIAAHEATLAALREARRDLEERVERRTAELSEANRKLAVASREAVHRSRNLLAVVSSLARHTAQGGGDVATFLERFGGRLEALSTATATVTRGPTSASADLETVARRQLEPILMTFGDRVRIEGPAVEIGPEAAQQIALALHELATNALKFGALAASAGTVRLSWAQEAAGSEPALALRWREAGGPAAAVAPEQAAGGFGSALLLRAVPAMLQGNARRSFVAGAMEYELRAPLAALAPRRIEEEEPGVDFAGAVRSAAD